LNRLKKQLLNSGIGEFAALCTFIFVYKILNLGMSSLIAFSLSYTNIISRKHVLVL